MSIAAEPKLKPLGETAAIRQAFAQFPSGVVALAVEHDGVKHALVASSFMVGVSLEPCLVAVAVQKSSETWEHIRDAGAVGVSVFGQGQGGLTRKLAGRDRAARFEDVAVEVGEKGAVFIDDASLWMECSVHQVVEAGDHWIALLEVEKLGTGNKDPLLWHGATFREFAELEGGGEK